MMIERMYKETKVLKRKLKPTKKLKKLAHYTKKEYKTKTQPAMKKFNEAFNKWPSL